MSTGSGVTGAEKTVPVAHNVTMIFKPETGTSLNFLISELDADQGTTPHSGRFCPGTTWIVGWVDYSRVEFDEVKGEKTQFSDRNITPVVYPNLYKIRTCRIS